MNYISTRGGSDPVSFSAAVAAGLAPDGGLYLPESLPDLSEHLEDWSKLNYPELCFEFFRLFATDLPKSVLHKRVEQSYTLFSNNKIAPLKKLEKDHYVLELFHGPTLAFKDFALQLLGNLYEEQIKRSKVSINVLGATSGDTGSAAIHGLLGKKGVNIFILYPQGRISPLQESQMTTTGANNVFPIAIEGTFDDAQRIVKDIMGNLELKDKFKLSAINSINLARILAQCVYYIFAFYQLPKTARKHVEFVVPTGNFGNILAGWLVQKMGLPVESFCVATNQNDILYRLFTTGRYEVDAVQPSLAPSMDIQVASNFERFLYYTEGENPERVRTVMQTLKETGQYRFENFDADTFTASRMDDDEIVHMTQTVFKKYNYVVDPHTACGFKDKAAGKTTVVLATAHPAKFPDAISQAIGQAVTAEPLEAIKAEAMINYRLPASCEAIIEFLNTHAIVSNGN